MHRFIAGGTCIRLKRWKALTVMVTVPEGVVPPVVAMVPLTVTGAFAAGLVGVTVWVMVVGVVGPDGAVTVMGVEPEAPGPSELPGLGVYALVTA